MEPLKLQRSQSGMRSFLAQQKSYRSFFDQNFWAISQENAKDLQNIEKKTMQLKQRQKLLTQLLKKYKKALEQQVKKFIELQKVQKLAIEEKSKQVEFLSIENAQLKEEKTELYGLKEEKQLLDLKYQQLQKQKLRLQQQLTLTQQKYQELKLQFDQKSELLQSGIKSNKLQTQQTGSNLQAQSMLEVENLTAALQEQKKKQVQQAIIKQEQKLKTQSLQITAILETFLQNVSLDKQKSQEKQNQILSSIKFSDGDKLQQLTEELRRKSDEISRVIVNSHQMWRDLRDRQTQILRLSLNLNDHKKQIQQKNNQLLTLQNSIINFQNQSKARMQSQKKNQEKHNLNFEQFEQKIKKRIQEETLSQFKNFYDIFINLSSQVFNVFRNSLNDSDKTGQLFIQSVTKIIDVNLRKINQFFTQILQLQNEKIQKMAKFIKKADQIAKKNQGDEHFDSEQRNMLSQSTPDRFSFKQAYHHQRQQSQSSLKSEKRKSILLQHDMDSAINYEEYMDTLKQEALQQQLTDLKNSQVIIESLKEGVQWSQLASQGSLSDSISRSQVSSLSQAEQTRGHNEKKKTTLINAKLKKKKKN